MRIFLLFLLFPCCLSGQDFTGVWTGTLTMQKSQFLYELVISGNNDRLSGYSLTVFTIDGIENTGIKTVEIKTKKTSLVIEDNDLVFDDYKTPSKKVKMFSKLAYTDGDAPVLEGTFFTRSSDKTSFNGTIRLQKSGATAGSRLMKHLKELDLLANLSFLHEPAGGAKEPTSSTAQVTRDEALQKDETIAVQTPARLGIPVALPKQAAPINSPQYRPGMVASTGLNLVKVAADIDNRKTEVIRVIEFNADSLVLNLYDNGEVDGDTVSVLANGQVVVAMKALSTIAVTTTIYTPPGSVDSLQLTMYAENLGRIGANTGLLIIDAGGEKYQVRFEGDFGKNSAVIFRRKR